MKPIVAKLIQTLSAPTILFSICFIVGTARAESPQKVDRWKMMAFSIQSNSPSSSVSCEKVHFYNQFVISRDTVAGALFFSERYSCLEKVYGFDRLEFLIAPETHETLKIQFLLKLTHWRLHSQVSVDKLADPVEQLPKIDANKRELGLQKIGRYKFVFGDETVEYGKRVGETVSKLNCKTYIPTIAGLRNPLAKRTMECRGSLGQGSSISLQFAEADASEK